MLYLCIRKLIITKSDTVANQIGFNKMTRQEFIQVLKNAQVKFHNNFSHIYGSDYYTIDGFSIRISDHSKNDDYGKSVYILGETDFRNYADAFEVLKTKVDLSDKTDAQVRFENEAKNRVIYVIFSDGNSYPTVDGCTSETIENAISLAWRKHLRK